MIHYIWTFSGAGFLINLINESEMANCALDLCACPWIWLVAFSAFLLGIICAFLLWWCGYEARKTAIRCRGGVPGGQHLQPLEGNKFPVAVSSNGTVPLNESLPESSRRTGTTVDKPVKQEERSDDTKTSPQRTEPKLDMGKLANNVAGAASSSQSAHAQYPQCATGGTSNRESLGKKDQEAEEVVAVYSCPTPAVCHQLYSRYGIVGEDRVGRARAQGKENFNECAILDAFKHNRTEHQSPDR